MSKKYYNSNPIEILKKENASLTRQYKDLLIKMKRMQNEYESMYIKYVNENHIRENNIKNNYNKYQDLLQQHFQKEENNYLEEIKNLKMQIQEKDRIISVLQNNNVLLNDKLTKNELIFNLKEKDYQKQLFNKDRLLMKSSDVVKKNSQEVMEDIRKLKEDIKYFQNKVNNKYFQNKVNNNNNNCNSIENNQNNFNYFNNDYKKQKIKKSFSSNDFNNTNIKPCINIDNNNNINNLTNGNMKKIKNFYSNQISPYTIKNKINNNSEEIYKLKNRIINLINIIKQKDKEILYWKNMRQNLYRNNATQNCENFSNKNYLNNIRYNSEKKMMRRCISQTSSQMQRNRRKNINLYLVDTNINRPIKRNNIITVNNKTYK